MARAYELISADAHVLEPPDLWTDRLPRRFHAKAPRVVPDGDGGEAWQFAPGEPPAPIGIYASAGRHHDDVRWTGVTFADANPGNFDGAARLDEMDRDGVDAEVLYGSARMLSHFLADPDPAFHRAGVQAYAVQRPKPRGIRGDTLWGLAGNGAAAFMTDLPEIIASGVHDRFPGLTWVMAEAGAGWIPYILEQLDDRWWRNRGWLPVRLRHPPSLYFRRHWRATFMVDHAAVANRHRLGVENLLWSSDYPHHGCDWPESRRVVSALFRGVPERDRHRMCAQNAVALYGLPGAA